MGMDVVALDPADKTRGTFRRNAWGWRPLAQYCTGLYPTLTEACTYWHSNDGDGLDAETPSDLVHTIRPCPRDGHPLGCTQQQTKGANVNEQRMVLAGRIGPRWGAQLADGTVEARTPNPGALRAVFEIIDQKGAYDG